VNISDNELGVTVEGLFAVDSNVQSITPSPDHLMNVQVPLSTTTPTKICIGSFNLRDKKAIEGWWKADRWNSLPHPFWWLSY
jgi:hypothetical protein